MERAVYRPADEEKLPKGFVGFFGEVLASLDGSPRQLKVGFDFEYAEVGGRVVLDVVGGEPQFRLGDRVAKARFRGRWLAEHPVPMAVNRNTELVLEPTSGNRVRVRAIRAGKIVV